MYDFGMRRKGVEFACRAVVKSRARNNQKVAFLHSIIGSLKPVHTQHTEIIRMIRWQRAKPLKRADDWDLRALNKLTQLRHAVALSNTAANIK